MRRGQRTAAVAAAVLAVACIAGPASANEFAGVYSDDAYFGSSAYRSVVFAAQADNGLGIVRQPFDWSRIETSQGVYNFASYDDFVLRAAAAGVRVLPVVGAPPAFRSTGPSRDNYWFPPASNTDFAAFVVKLVQRYGPGGSLWAAHPELAARPIRSWQIWNEPNLLMFWGSGPNAAEYTAMLRTVHDAVHAADPTAEVVAAGLPNSLLGVPLENYLGAMYAAGALGSFDAMAVHAYAADAPDAIDLVALTRSLMTAYGDSAPLWVTEAGWSTGGPASPYTVDEATQAKIIGDLVHGLGMRRIALGLRGVVIFRWRDAVAQLDAWPLHAGVLRADATAKPALGALRSAIAGLDVTPRPPATDGPASGTAPAEHADIASDSAADLVARHTRIAITGGELSRFGFLRVHLECLDTGCKGRLRVGKPRTACGGQRAFALGDHQAVVLRVKLRAKPRRVRSCRRMLVTADTGANEPSAAAFLPRKTASTAAAGDVYGQASLPDSSAKWDGMLHMRIACAAGGPDCNVDATVYDPADTAHSLAGDAFRVAAGTTKSALIDPPGTASQKLAKLRSIVVRLRMLMPDGRQPEPPAPNYEKTLQLVHSSAGSPTPTKPVGPPTKRQVVKDKRGDSHRCFGLDIVRATATRKGRTVVFQVVSAGAMTAHDGFGNRITPGLEMSNPHGGGHTVQVGSDGSLRGYTRRVWPKVPTSVSSKTVTWKVPTKYLGKPSFKWRAECLEGYNVRDAAPNHGYKTFVR